jgi:acyl-CoA synthetase (NDP forming)
MPPAAGTSGLSRLLSPRSIAVVGASDRAGRIGTTVYQNIVRVFEGDIYPVNPRGGQILGREALPSVKDLPAGVDMAIVMVPAETVPETIRQCAERGVGGVTLLSSGFSEAGARGAELQEEVRRLSSETGVRVLGPNCIGFMNLHQGVMANFALPPETPLPDPGSVALVSQSGGFGSYITTKSLLAGLKLGWFVSTGNEVDVNLAAVLRHLVEDDTVNALMTFSETLRDPDVFMEAARRAHELDKPIILLKAGRSDEAARAALSHTASIVGSAQVLDAVCEQYGVQVVHTMEEMLDLGLMFQGGRRSGGSRLGIMTTSGGAGVLLADCAAQERLSVPEIPQPAARDIEQMMPQPFYGSIANPVDTTAQLGARPGAYEAVLNALLDIDELDMFTTVTWATPGPSNDAIVRAYDRTSKPFAVLSTGYLESFQQAGVPTFLDPLRAVHALAAVARFSSRPALDQPAAPPSPSAKALSVLDAAHGRRLLLESDGKQLLASYGIPVTREAVVPDATSAAVAAEEMGGAVALKVLSYELPHKSDYGALRLGVQGDDDVRAAFEAMLAEVRQRAPHATVEGVLVQEMVPARLEMTCGLTRDPVFGPVVSVGLGGVTIEILAEATMLRAPFSAATAERAIRRLAGGRMAKAGRGLTDVEVGVVAQVMVDLGTLALNHPEVSEVDINPLRVADGRCVAADALVVIADQTPDVAAAPVVADPAEEAAVG